MLMTFILYANAITILLSITQSPVPANEKNVTLQPVPGRKSLQKSLC